MGNPHCSCKLNACRQDDATPEDTAALSDWGFFFTQRGASPQRSMTNPCRTSPVPPKPSMKHPERTPCRAASAVDGDGGGRGGARGRREGRGVRPGASAGRVDGGDAGAETPPPWRNARSTSPCLRPRRLKRERIMMRIPAASACGPAVCSPSVSGAFLKVPCSCAGRGGAAGRALCQRHRPPRAGA